MEIHCAVLPNYICTHLLVPPGLRAVRPDAVRLCCSAGSRGTPLDTPEASRQ